MTITTNATSFQFPRNGTTTQWSIGCKIFSAADLVVNDLDTSTPPVVTPLVLGVDYTVQNVDVDTGCLITTTVPGIAGHTLDVRSSIAELQSTSIKNQGFFLPELHEEFFDKATRMLQDLFRKTYTYGIHGPDVEATPWPALPIASTRRGTTLVFDPVTGLPGVGITPSTVFTQALFNSFLGSSSLYPQTPAEVSAGVSPSSMIYDSGGPVIDVRRYGALLNGSNDYQAIYNACLVAGIVGGRLMIPGFASIASASLAIAPLPIGNNTELVGIGAGASGIIITGTSICYLATVTNPLNIRIADLSITGNSQANASQVGECFQFISNSAATANTGNITIERCVFTNFKGDYWLQFDNSQGTAFNLQNIWVRNNRFLSQPGNARDGTNRGVPANCLMFQGSLTSNAALCKNIWAHNNYADGTYIKTFAVAWASTLNVWVYDNDLDNFGQSGISLNAAAYAIFAYNNGITGTTDPDCIFFLRNKILNPLSCGIYSASNNRIFAKGNIISGQSDTNNGTIPKGAIAVNDALYAEVDDNELDNNFIGIAFTPARAGINKARRNRGTSSVAGGSGVLAIAGFSGQQIDTFEITDNDFVMSGASSSGVQVVATSTFGIKNLIVKNNPRLSGATCLLMFSTDSTVPNVTYADISDNVIAGNGSSGGIIWNSCSNAATRARIQNNRYVGTWATVASLLDIRASVGLTVKNEEFNDLTSGTGGTTSCITSAGAQGRMEGVRFNNVGTTYRYITTANFLGGTLPNWSGNDNDFVQDLNTTELGSTSSKYTRQGWQWDATNAAWKEVRCLTGN